MPYIHRDDASLYYEVYDTGQPLVFLHDKEANSFFWWQQVDFSRAASAASWWLAALNPPLPPSPEVAEAAVSPAMLPRYTLFITGAEDEVVPPEVVRGAAALVPTSRFEVTPGSGHSPYFERASLYNRVVDEFLQV